MCFQQMVLQGPLKDDAKMVKRTDGDALEFIIGVPKTYHKDSPKDYFKCVLSDDRRTKLAKYLKKGKSILVCGKFNVDVQEKNGVKFRSYELQVKELTFCAGGKK